VLFHNLSTNELSQVQQQQQRIRLGSLFLADLPGTRRIDTRGLACPYPAFETAKAISAVSDQDVVEIITNDKYVALNSLPTVLKLREFDFAVIESGSEENFILKAKRKTRQAL
jgi:TusA-related sulfurtransferase